MRRIPSWGIILGIVIVAIAFGGGLGWWVSRDNVVDAPKAPVVVQQENHETEIPQVAVANTQEPKKGTVANPQETEAQDPATPEEPKTAAASQWQDVLDEVLTSEGEPEQKADRLLRMMPLLGQEAQVEVSQHLVNFVNDDRYLPIAQMLTNSTTAEAVDTVLMTDLLNRNDGIKLPLLLSMARNESHPKHGEAKELLELYLQENHGDDWNQWESSVTNYLAQNGSEFTLEAPPEPTTTANP